MRRAASALDLRDVFSATGLCIDSGRLVVRQTQAGENEPGRLVDCVVGAVPIGQLSRFEAAGDIPNELLDVHAARIYHAHGRSACRIVA